jgi:hypothetical protein
MEGLGVLLIALGVAFALMTWSGTTGNVLHFLFTGAVA